MHAIDYVVIVVLSPAEIANIVMYIMVSHVSWYACYTYITWNAIHTYHYPEIMVVIKPLLNFTT